jgi:hypothetical protein
MSYWMARLELPDVRETMLVDPNRKIRILASDATDPDEQRLGQIDDVERLPCGKTEL